MQVGKPLAMIVLIGAATAIALGISHGSRPQPVTSPCAWPAALNPDTLSRNSQVNVSNPDTASDYWIMPIPAEAGLRVTLSGRYPDSRYMSIAVYNPDGTPFTVNGVRSTLTDDQITPDAASVNPWQHEAAPGGRFTVTLRSDVAAGQVNTLPIAPAAAKPGTTDTIFYRVYAASTDPGHVPLPTITLTRNGVSTTLPQCPVGDQDRIPASYCAIPWVAKEAPVCTGVDPAAASDAAATVVPFARDAIGSGGTPDNDIGYLSATVAPRPNGDLLVIRAKAVTAPEGPGPIPWPRPGTDVRYWSLCIDRARPPIPVVINTLPGGAVDDGCRYDRQVALDGAGYYTFVIGTEAQRAAVERIPDVTFLPLSATHPNQRYKLNLRHMLAVQGFRNAVQDVPADGRSASAAAVMGAYYPRVAFCSPATLTAGPAGCMRDAVPVSERVNGAAAGPPLRRIATVLFVCAIAGWAVLETVQGLRRRRAPLPAGRRADRASLLVVFASAIAAVILARLAIARAPWATVPGGIITFGIGLVIMYTGVSLRWWSFRTLGRYFTYTVTTSPDQPVITGGPYRFVRHPGYLGYVLVLTGIGVMQSNWLSIAALALVPLVGFGYRIRVEEDALLTDLGDRYAAYASGRRRLVPFVW